MILVYKCNIILTKCNNFKVYAINMFLLFVLWHLKSMQLSSYLNVNSISLTTFRISFRIFTLCSCLCMTFAYYISENHSLYRDRPRKGIRHQYNLPDMNRSLLVPHFIRETQTILFSGWHIYMAVAKYLFW